MVKISIKSQHMELNLYIFSLNQLLANERNVQKMYFFKIDNFTVYLIFFFFINEKITFRVITFKLFLCE